MANRNTQKRGLAGPALLSGVLAAVLATACVDDAVLGPADAQSDVAATPLSTSGSGIGAVDEVHAVIDSQARLVVAHVATADGQLRVARHDGLAWEQLGAVVAGDGVRSVQLAVDHHSRTVMAFNDPDADGRISVTRYESGSWQALGTGITLNAAWASGIATDASGRPLVALIDFEDDGAGGLGEFVGLSVLERSQTATEDDATANDGWTYLGSRGFTATDPARSPGVTPVVTNVSLAIDAEGPWVAYNNGNFGGLARAWSGADWPPPGGSTYYSESAYSASPIYQTTMADGDRVVQFFGETGDGDAAVFTRRLETGGWQDLGSPVAMGPTFTFRGGLAVGPEGALYLAYTRAEAPDTLVLERWDGSWTSLLEVPLASGSFGSTGLSQGGGRFVLWYIDDAGELGLLEIERLD